MAGPGSARIPGPFADDSTPRARPATIAPSMTDRLVDKRTIERNIQKGLITEANYAKYLAALPDLASKATFVDYSVDEDAEIDDEDEE